MDTPPERSPLEEFLRDYAEVAGGLWDEVEPQVYDLLLPSSRGGGGGDPEEFRIAFDPEAVPEHPGSQLASFGTPLVDHLLVDALDRGRHVRLYFVGLNLAPQGLAGRVSKALRIPEGFALTIARTRPTHFPQAVFWFEATFVSDQKEQELLPAAIDVHHGRQVRHLERLLDRAHLAEAPWEPLPEARHRGLLSAYGSARDRVLRTAAALANTRLRELTDRLDRQVERMSRYYADLRAEVDTQTSRAGARFAAPEDLAKFASRREALEREEQLRVAELRQKSTLRVELRLINVLVIEQPKLGIRASLQSASGARVPLELVWDPLTEALEAVACPGCGQPTFEIRVDRFGRAHCPACPSPATPPPRPPTRR